MKLKGKVYKTVVRPGAKIIKKNTKLDSKQTSNRAKQYKVTSFLSTDCELSTNPCSKNVYNLGPQLCCMVQRPGQQRGDKKHD